MAKKMVVVNDDGHGGFFEGRFDTRHSLEQSVEEYRGTGVTVLEWCINMGTKVNFMSDHFDLFGEGGRSDIGLPMARRGDRKIAATLAGFRKNGWDPLDIVTRKAHDIGIQAHASIRMNPDYDPNWMGDWLPNSYNDSFYFEHPDCRIRKKDGSFEYKLSYAYEAVSNRKLLLVKELLRYPIDGLSLDYMRHPPFLGYEDPVIAGFEAQFGIDPRSLPDNDPRWIETKCSIMTEFMRKVRLLAGKRAISVRVDHRVYMQQGLDIRTWIKEGLIDTLILGQRSHGGYEIDLKPFRQMAGSGCSLLFGEEAVCGGHDLTAEEDRAIAAGTMQRPPSIRMPFDRYCSRALRWYDEGADGVHIFNDPYHYKLFSVIGDPERCRAALSET